MKIQISGALRDLLEEHGGGAFDMKFRGTIPVKVPPTFPSLPFPSLPYPFLLSLPSVTASHRGKGKCLPTGSKRQPSPPEPHTPSTVLHQRLSPTSDTVQ